MQGGSFGASGKPLTSQPVLAMCSPVNPATIAAPAAERPSYAFDDGLHLRTFNASGLMTFVGFKLMKFSTLSKAASK